GISQIGTGAVTFNTNVTTPTTNVSNGVMTVGSTATLRSTTSATVATSTLNVNGVLATPALAINDGGSVLVDSTGSLDSGTAVATTSLGALTLRNASQSVASISGPGSVHLIGTALNVTGAGTVAALIDGSGSLVKNTSGGLTLTNANTYTGGTTVSA